jgi:hypothetical protein
LKQKIPLSFFEFTKMPHIFLQKRKPHSSAKHCWTKNNKRRKCAKYERRKVSDTLEGGVGV